MSTCGTSEADMMILEGFKLRAGKWGQDWDFKSFDDGSSTWLELEEGAWVFSLQCDDNVLKVGAHLDVSRINPSSKTFAEIDSSTVTTWTQAIKWVNGFLDIGLRDV